MLLIAITNYLKISSEIRMHQKNSLNTVFHCYIRTYTACGIVSTVVAKRQKVSKWYKSVTFLRWDAILLSSVFKKMVINKEMVLTRSNIAWLKMIIWVSGALIKTVVGEWCFDNLCGSHQFILQSQGIDFSQNPGERLDWSLDREAVGKRMMRLIYSSTCLYFTYHTSRWNVKYFCFVVLTWISGMKKKYKMLVIKLPVI